MNQEAPLHVTVLVRAIDAGSRIERVWRLSQHLSLTTLRLRRDLPFEPGRPVALSLALPDDEGDRTLQLTGIVRRVAPSRSEQDELEEAGLDPREPRPRALELIDLTPEHREALLRYIEERNMES